MSEVPMPDLHALTDAELDADLSNETDAVLDGTLLRLYAQHRDAEGQERADVHTAIMCVVCEMRRRLDAWLVER